MPNIFNTVTSATRAGRIAIRQFLSVGESLRERVVRGSLAVLAGAAYVQFARLAGNLIMTRLLFPEAFGLMLIVNIVVEASVQLSDAGVRQAVIAKRGEIEDRFLDTAWTMLVIRGGALTLIIFLVAYPVSLAYEEPQLFYLLVLASAVPLIQSLASPLPIIYERNVRPTRYVILNICATTGALILTIVWLLVEPTVLALAANGVFAAVIRTTLSYAFFRGRIPRLFWDKSTVLELFRFGRWIFLGTALSFLARKGDQVIIINWTTAATLGLFSIAVNLSRLPQVLIGKLSYGVLLAAYAELRTAGSDLVSKEVVRIKLAIYAACLPLLLVLTVFGQDLVDLLYDPRYQEAGWMLEVLAIGMVFFAAGTALHGIPLSYGDSYRHMWRQVLSLAALTGSMIVGGLLAGFPGLLAGSVVAQALDYLIIKLAVRKYGIKDIAVDLTFICLSLFAVLVCWAIRGWPWQTTY